MSRTNYRTEPDAVHDRIRQRVKIRAAAEAAGRRSTRRGRVPGQMWLPMDLMWARAIVAQCRVARVPVFVKQLGRRPYDSVTAWLMVDRAFEPTPTHAQQLASLALKSPKGGDWDEWPAELRFREFPRVPVLEGSR